MDYIPDRYLPRAARLELRRRALAQRRMTGAELAQGFHISEATLYRDLALLGSEPFYENVVSATVYYLAPVAGGEASDG